MTTSAQLRAAIYDRESKGSEGSINSQNAQNLAAVEENGWLLAGAYTDGVSASRFGTKVRGDWDKFLRDLVAGVMDVVVTAEPSRADRNLATWVPFVELCRARGVLIHLSGEDETMDPRKPSHWKRLMDDGVNAAFETERLSVRTLRGVASAASNGDFHGRAPYGFYRVVVDWKTVRRGSKNVKKPVYEQRPHDEHSLVVKEIIDRVARQTPIITIAADLNARGVPSPEGREWNRATVRRTALNVAYIGQRRHLGRIHEGTWAGFIDAATFHAAGQVLADPARMKTKPGQVKRLLSYIAVATCGASLHYKPESQGRQAGYHCATDGCVAVAAEPADEYVASVVVDRLSRPGARGLYVRQDDPAARKAVNDAARLRTKLAEARESFARIDGISAASLADIEQRLAPMIEAADKRATPAGASLPLLELLTAAEAGDQYVRPAWDALSIPARREVLKLLFDGIRVGKLTHRLTRVATREQRYVATAARISFE